MKSFIYYNSKESHLIAVCLRIFIVLGLILYPTSVVAAKVVTTTSASIVQNEIQTKLPSFEQTSEQGEPFTAPLVLENPSTNPVNGSGHFIGCEVSNSSWHGTHVAGTIAASSNNGSGVSGINWNSKILPVRALGKCGGYDSDIIDGMRWAAGLSVSGVPINSNPAKVINLSIGGEGSCTSSYQTAINEITATGTTIVVAAGNDNNNASLYAPGNCNGVITVSATDRTGNRSFYSNYGPAVEISAPGGDTTYSSTNGILSTLNTGTQGPVADTFAYYQGTSMAAPHVSGVASLLYSMNPAYTPAQILSILQGNATAFPAGSTCSTSLCGAGIVNAGSAVLAAVPQAPASFVKISPTNGAINQLRNLTLSWGTSAQATSYQYCIDTTNDNACTTWVDNGTSTSITFTGLSTSTTYYWQVKAINSIGTTPADGSDTAFWSFTTGTNFNNPSSYGVYLPLISRGWPNQIQNGGFESGDVVWNEYSSNGWDLIVNTTQGLPLSPHNGSWLAWLGGDINETSQISQTVAIPVGRSILHFWVYTASEDACGYDALGVHIGSDVVYSQRVCNSNDTNGWVHKTVDLTSYAGQTKEISFLAELDSALNSSVWVDDISLEATTSLSYSMSENVTLDRSDLDHPSLAKIEMNKEERYRK